MDAQNRDLLIEARRAILRADHKHAIRCIDLVIESNIAFAEHRAGLVNDGYEPTYNDIDRSVSESEPCRACGGQTKYEGWKSPKHISYLAFSICQSCGHWFDF